MYVYGGYGGFGSIERLELSEAISANNICSWVTIWINEECSRFNYISAFNSTDLIIFEKQYVKEDYFGESLHIKLCKFNTETGE